MTYSLKNELEASEQGGTGGRSECQAEGTVWVRAALPFVEPCAGEREESGEGQSLGLETGVRAHGSQLVLSLLPLWKVHGRALRRGEAGALILMGAMSSTSVA